MVLDPLPPRLGAPPGLVVDTFEEGGDIYALLEWSVRNDSPDVARASGPVKVPAAQREVLGLVLAGLSNEEIARRRRRSERTVAHQVAALFRRLDVGSRAELLALAARQGWIRGEP